MGQNSIIANLSKEDIVAEIRILLGADFKKRKLIVLVEGDDDIRFLLGIVSKNVSLCESYSGKTGVIEIVNRFSDSRVIGICDKDYDYNNVCSRVFYYDFSCLEMMLISNESVSKSALPRFYNGEMNSQDLLQLILRELLFLSVLRKINSERNLSIIFKKVLIEKAVDCTTYKLNKSVITEQLKERNPGNIKIDGLVLEAISQCSNYCSLSSYFNVTQGHDFISYFRLICKNEKKYGKEMGNKNIFLGLVFSYQKEHFYETTLFSELSKYQKQTRQKVVEVA